MRDTSTERDDEDAARDAWSQQRRIAELAFSLRRSQAETAALRQSVSWRLTAPLRAGYRLLHRFGIGAPDYPPGLSSHPEVRNAVSSRGSDERCLFVDVTAFSLGGEFGGIEHVVKGVLGELLFAAPQGWRVLPVALSREGEYVSASREIAERFGASAPPSGTECINAKPGDIFLALDLIRDYAALAKNSIERLKADGARIACVVYDLLPLQYPHYFPSGVSARFAEWMNAVVLRSDVLACISETVAAQLREWFLVHGRSSEAPEVGVFPLAADVPPRFAPRSFVRDKRSALIMVGTVEPRKCHGLALDAMERLWGEGHIASLTIVGRQGWHSRQLAARIRRHTRYGTHLFWEENATDDEVYRQYASAEALLACSVAEGYGLPIVEAASCNLDLILRDIPEFREASTGRALYFGSRQDGDPYAAIKAWLEGAPIERPPLTERATWANATDRLLDVIGAASQHRRRVVAIGA